MPPLAYVRIGYSQLAYDWVVAVGMLLEAIEEEDILASEKIKDGARAVRRVMWNATVKGD